MDDITIRWIFLYHLWKFLKASIGTTPSVDQPINHRGTRGTSASASWHSRRGAIQSPGPERSQNKVARNIEIIFLKKVVALKIYQYDSICTESI